MTPAPALEDEMAVRLFPLPRVVLFPGMLLPLLVFEPRYRALVGDALAADRLLGIPRLVPGFEAQYGGCPPICGTFGVGRIIDDVKLPDGRYRIVVSGLARARLISELVQEPYRVAQVQTLREQPETSLTISALHASLQSQASKLAQRLGDDAQGLSQAIRDAASAAECTDLVAATLISDDALRQQLLETPSVQSRLESLVGHVHNLLLHLDGAEPTAEPN
jgi:uncharacterized protein